MDSHVRRNIVHAIIIITGFLVGIGLLLYAANLESETCIRDSVTNEVHCGELYGG